MISLVLIPVSQCIDLILDEIKILDITIVTILRWLVKIHLDSIIELDQIESIIY
jgi:hypothetical protein